MGHVVVSVLYVVTPLHQYYSYSTTAIENIPHYTIFLRRRLITTPTTLTTLIPQPAPPYNRVRESSSYRRCNRRSKYVSLLSFFYHRTSFVNVSLTSYIYTYPRTIESRKMASGVSARSISGLIPVIPLSSQSSCCFSDPVHVFEQLPGVQGPYSGPVQRNRCQSRPGVWIRRHQQTGRIPQEVPPRKGEWNILSKLKDASRNSLDLFPPPFLPLPSTSKSTGVIYVVY